MVYALSLIHIYKGAVRRRRMVYVRIGCGGRNGVYAGERAALPKSTPSNRCDTIWDIYAEMCIRDSAYTMWTAHSRDYPGDLRRAVG